MRKFFLTAGYAGLAPKAPGTAGSVVGLALGGAILQILPQSTLFLLAILIAIVAIKEIDIYEKETNTHDDPKIVIDEVVGIWIALSLSSGSVWQYLFSFLFFRLFDIWKPSYIGKVQNAKKGGVSVVADDALAGLFAGLCSELCYKLVVALM